MRTYSFIFFLHQLFHVQVIVMLLEGHEACNLGLIEVVRRLYTVPYSWNVQILIMEHNLPWLWFNYQVWKKAHLLREVFPDYPVKYLFSAIIP